jgi:hypothetical protein
VAAAFRKTATRQLRPCVAAVSGDFGGRPELPALSKIKINPRRRRPPREFRPRTRPNGDAERLFTNTFRLLNRSVAEFGGLAAFATKTRRLDGETCMHLPCRQSRRPPLRYFNVSKVFILGKIMMP